MQEDGPDISQLSIRLQEQWDDAANTHVGSIVIRPYTARKVWWRCDQCPDTHPHLWLAAVSCRSGGQGCPYCRGQRVCMHNSLSTTAPLVAAEWHPTRNDCTPEEVTAGTDKQAHWLCSVCTHTWSALIHSRTQGSGCPMCNHPREHSWTRQPTFAECNHPLLAEWDHQRNAAAGMTPQNIHLKSNKQVFWLCSKCPAGQEHSYSAPPHSRTKFRRPTGCPCCAGRKACKCNSLHTHFPQLVAEWDFVRNEGTPKDAAYSHCAAWWVSAEGASWSERIDACAVRIDRQAQRERLRVGCAPTSRLHKGAVGTISRTCCRNDCKVALAPEVLLQRRST